MISVLWQGHRLTLLCILDCAAHLLPMPKEVETNFLNQTIKVFTKVSKKNKEVHYITQMQTRVTCIHGCSSLCFPLAQIEAPSVKNESLYTTLKAILSPTLHELFLRATQEAAGP